MEFDATFWAFVCLVLFLILVTYLKVPGMITKTIDARIAQVEKDLAEAARLRSEAEALLVEYDAKRKAAEAEAAEIVANAREDAARMTAEAKLALEDMVARKTRSVENKIAQAEAQAISEVRARSADVAIEAARIILSEQVKNSGPGIISKSITDVASKLN